MLKPLSLTLGVLLLCVFVATFVAGFVVDIHTHGVSCGAPFQVVDGRYADGVPTDLHDACQGAGNRWIGLSMIPFLALIVSTGALAFTDQRRRKRRERQLLDGSNLL